MGALGENSYTAVQLASILSASNMKLVPDVVLGEGRGNLADVLLARMATGRVDLAPQLTATQANGHSKPAIAAPPSGGPTAMELQVVDSNRALATSRSSGRTRALR